MVTNSGEQIIHHRQTSRSSSDPAEVRLGVKGSQVSCPVSPTERRTIIRASQAVVRACRVVGGVTRHHVSDLLRRAGRR
jgi:hypothetical protein